MLKDAVGSAINDSRHLKERNIFFSFILAEM